MKSFNKNKNTINQLPNIAFLLLAAGASNRMGQPKQLLKIKGTQTLLEHTLHTAKASNCHSVVVVLGANVLRIKKVLARGNSPITTVFNKDWEQGMGSSLRTGLQYLVEENPKIDAVIISVCDQPYLTPTIINQLIQTYREGDFPIVSSDYGVRLGVPALLDRQFFPQLLALKADEGARKIIRSNPDLVATIDFPKGAIDLDTPAAYQEFLKTSLEDNN